MNDKAMTTETQRHRGDERESQQQTSVVLLEFVRRSLCLCVSVVNAVAVDF